MGSNGRFSDGFLLGALIGGVGVFLLGTTKGNKVLKALTEEGMAGLTDLIETLEDSKTGKAPLPEKIEDRARVVIDELEEKLDAITPDKKVEGNHASKASARKFFRKSK